MPITAVSIHKGVAVGVGRGVAVGVGSRVEVGMGVAVLVGGGKVGRAETAVVAVAGRGGGVVGK
jgi:hypothetical protein